MLIQPSPTTAKFDVADVSLANPVSGSNFYLWSRRFSNLKHLLFGDLRLGIASAARGCAVKYSIGHIFRVTSPPQMIRIHASTMAISTGMSSFMLWCRGGAMPEFAHNAAGRAHSTVNTHFPTAHGFPTKWPEQALIAGKRDMIVKPLQRDTPCRSSRQRIAVMTPTIPMSRAPSTASRRLVTSVNVANSLAAFFILGDFHSGLSPVKLGPVKSAPLDGNPVGRSLFVNQKSFVNNGAVQCCL